MKTLLTAIAFSVMLALALSACKAEPPARPPPWAEPVAPAPWAVQAPMPETRPAEPPVPAPIPQPVKEEAMSENEARKFVSEIEGLAAPAEKAMNRAMWQAWISGKDEDYKKYEELQLAYRKVYADRARYAGLKRALASPLVKDPILRRQLTIAVNESIENQIDERLLAEIVAKSAEVEKKFNTFRSTLRGEAVTMNQIKDILRSSTDRVLRKDAYISQKKVGELIDLDIGSLITLRNEAAKQVGFADYYELRLAAGELSKADVKKLFDELAAATEAPFAAAKAELDGLIASRLEIKPEDLLPWDYSDPYFQELPEVLPKADLSDYFKRVDVKDFALAFFDGLGFEARDILKRSSLYELPGKNPHAFSVSMDRTGDVRILCNLKNDEYWAGTILHELGHALYDKHANPQLPWLLRMPSNQFITEGIAEMFGRMTRKPAVLAKLAGVPQKDLAELAPILEKSLRYGMLIFARWSLVMVNFEMQAYANPDANLTNLWWQLVEKYQKLRKTQEHMGPDWASKIHIASAPAYYHNYVMGEMFASQLLHALAAGDPNAVDFIDKPQYGKILKEKVFVPASSVHWKELVKSATGEEFTAHYFVEQFVK